MKRLAAKYEWFLVEIIEIYEPLESDNSKELRRVTTWGNFHLVKASTPSIAYDKGLRIGKISNYKFTNSEGTEMMSKFLGIGDLIPVVDKIEDGSELFWDNYGFISARRAVSLAKSKEELINRLKRSDK